MRKAFLMVLCLFLMLSFCGCGGNVQDDTLLEDKNYERTEETQKLLNQEEIINVYLDLRLYKSLLGEEFDFSLSQRDKDKGFLSVNKYDDNTAVFTIKRKDFIKFKEDYRSSRKRILDDYRKNNEKYCVEKVEYNESITEIVVTVDKAVYTPEISYINQEYINAFNTISGSGRNAIMYHMYHLGEIPKCTVTVKDLNGNILETRVYPDEILEEFK